MVDPLRPASAAALVATIAASTVFATSATLASMRPASADAIGYVAPKRLKQGIPTSQIAGAGTVSVKVFVLANGSPKSVSVNTSTNHGDDAAAKEAAMTATYKPALRGGKPVAAFFTYKITFVGQAMSADDLNVSGGGVATIEALNRSGKFAEAKKMGQAFIASHPSDSAAAVATAVAASFDGDSVTAAELFDKAASIPDKYKGPAASAFLAQASAKFAAKDYVAATNYAKKGAALAPGAGSYNILANAELAGGDVPSAIADFEKAKASIASDAKATPKQVGTINMNLAQAYLKAGDVDKAEAAFADAKKAEPDRTMDDAFAEYYQEKGTAAVKAGNTDVAVAAFESAAKAAPKYAVVMYMNGANAYGKAAKPDFKKMKAEADKALALDANNAQANLIAGVALVNDGQTKDGLVYLNKADTLAKAGTDTALQAQITATLKSVNGGTAKK